MTVDQVLKGLKACSSDEGCNQCPYQIADPEGHDCAKMVMRDAMSLIMQGELNEGTIKLVNDQGDMIDELNCWNKLLWRFIHSDKKIEDAFYKFYNIKQTNGPIAQ